MRGPPSLISALVVLALSGPAAASSAGVPLDSLANLDAASIREQLGRLPECVQLVEGRVCTWHLARWDAGYASVAQAAGIDARLTVLCVFPERGSEQPAAECSAHRVQKPVPEGAGEEADRARRLLGEAAGLLDLVRLLGAGPDECVAREGSRLCMWRASKALPGYLIAAAAMGETDRFRIVCELPPGDEPRAPGSCRSIPPK